MSVLLIVAIIAMVLALTFYSLGVWGEKLSGGLKGKHLAFFWTGFVFDSLGTWSMGEISAGWEFSVHSVTGFLALVLMAIHAVWATVVYARKKPQELVGFHKLSLVVWGIWLLPFFIGMAMAMLG